MENRHPFGVFTLLVALVLAGCSPERPKNHELVEGFRNPGNEARPRAYWNWLNGDVTLAGITRDLEEAKEKGLGGLQIWDTEAMRNPDGFVPAGPAFLGEESLEAIHHAMKQAARLDLDLGLVCASGWNSGGAWVTPEMAGKNLFHSSVVVSGPCRIKQKLPFPEVPPNCPKRADGLPVWSREVALLAWPDSGERIIPELSDIQDISDKFSNGELIWEAPPGKWQVVRFVCTNNGQQLIAASPNSKGLFIDFLDPEATRFHFEYIFRQLGLTKGVANNTSLKTLDDDSMELHEGIPWTNGFQSWFQNEYGYSPVSWLPVFLGWEVENKDASDRFQYDYHKAVSDLLIFSHYTTGSQVCEEYGVQLVAEAGGPGPPFWNTCPVDALKALGNVHVPRGEFWLKNPRNLFLIKEIASASHIYGKKYVDAESWTTWRRWRDGLTERKRLVDRAFCEGLNRVTYHGFAHSPVEDEYPGRAYHAGSEINPKELWWSKAPPFMDYLARCCFLLQQGLYVADVAYYYGDQAPNFWPYYHNVPEKPGIDGLGKGYEYDVVNTDVILNRMSVTKGRIVLPDGMSYRILVLRAKEDMPLEVLQKLEKLVSEGATVLGPKPLRVPGLQDLQKRSEKLDSLAGRMWGDCNGLTVKENEYGKGRIVWGYTPEQWLKKNGVGPDFICTDPQVDPDLDFIHRETAHSQIYFVSNKTQKSLSAQCSFRIEKAIPQIWDPSGGSMTDPVNYGIMDGNLTLPVLLPPGGSIFVVFDKRFSPSGKKSSAVRESDTHEDILATRVIDGPWNVAFDSAWGAPEKVVFPELISWTEHENPGIKYYSGQGTYLKTVAVPEDWIGEGRAIYLDLGSVREIAEVYLNGKSAGVLWKPPFRADITRLVKPGDNELKIEVLNLWINRLTGDSKVPESERFTKTNIRSDGGSWLPNYTEWQEEPAGLLGPVRLLSMHQ